MLLHANDHAYTLEEYSSLPQFLGFAFTLILSFHPIHWENSCPIETRGCALLFSTRLKLELPSCSKSKCPFLGPGLNVSLSLLLTGQWVLPWNGRIAILQLAGRVNWGVNWVYILSHWLPHFFLLETELAAICSVEKRYHIRKYIKNRSHWDLFEVMLPRVIFFFYIWENLESLEDLRGLLKELKMCFGDSSFHSKWNESQEQQERGLKR